MAAQGPVSVLDSGRRNSSAGTVRDRITRHQSPGRYSNKGGPDDDFEVGYRIAQPYRTSFSATHSVEKIGSRSRSLSPASSLRSGRSGKSHRSRSKSPKRVTYDTRVTVRHSDTDDSMFTELSSHEFESSPYYYKYNTSPANKLNISTRSADSGIDYSSQLRDISQQIIKMDWSPNNSIEKSSPSPPHGILKDTQNSASKSPMSHQSNQILPQSSRSPNHGNKENSLSGANSPDYDLPKGRSNISKEYYHDRTISYRMAVQDQPSEEMKQLAAAMLEEKAPEENGVRKERSNTMPTQRLNGNGRLSPTKRSVSSSISNFFRKISPRLGRKGSKDRAGKTGSSATGSAQSLTTSDVSVEQEGEGSHFSRSRVRKSIMKLIGRSKSRSKSRGDGAKKSPQKKDEYSVKGKELDMVDNTTPNNKQQLPNSTNRMLKSIERNALSDKDVYQKFKEKQSPNRPGEGTPTGQKPLAVKPVQNSVSELGYNNLEITNGKNIQSSYVSFDKVEPSTEVQDLELLTKPDPPKSLDVIPPRAVKTLQTSVISSISGDESIGECSLDVNLTASEPSLLSGTSQSTGSKQVVISQDLVDSTEGQLPSESSSGKRSRERGVLNSVLTESDKENAIPEPKSPLANSWDILPQEPSRKPSYLKLSCAVSGYGRYSQYTSYKNIEKRSPFSSTSSLRSVPSSPDMPSVRSPSEERTRDECLRAAVGHSLANGQDRNGSILNGHSQVYPTGDCIKDGEYFLQATQMEEDRLQSFCTRAEIDIAAPVLPEEASGRIRAAIGKANLLISQKFQQFRELCSHHMHPDLSEKPTKWEDLQGFWDMIKIQVDSVDDLFAEIELMRLNGWKEIPRQPSRRSSSSSSPKSGSLSQGSTPCHTPGSKRRGLKTKDTPESSPERVQKARLAAKARDDARKKMLAEKRAAMKQQNQQGGQDVEIYVPEPGKK